MESGTILVCLTCFDRAFFFPFSFSRCFSGTRPCLRAPNLHMHTHPLSPRTSNSAGGGLLLYKKCKNRAEKFRYNPEPDVLIALFDH